MTGPFYIPSLLALVSSHAISLDVHDYQCLNLKIHIVSRLVDHPLPDITSVGILNCDYCGSRWFVLQRITEQLHLHVEVH
jgi:DNA-directed RNA polymerase subunit RPC12/RpoP